MLQERGIKIPCQTINNFISGLFCKPPNDQYFLSNACLSSTCDMCGNLSLFGECLHENALTTFGQELIDVKRFKTIEYLLKDEKIGRRCDLVTDKVSCHAFMDEFKSVIIPKYINTLNMLDDLMDNFAYVRIHFQLVLYFQLLTL